ncbi:MAG: extracellular solute-binding protein [Treponema sp.]|nr:extracellular solute-binding protein [Treponema sp.]
MLFDSYNELGFCRGSAIFRAGGGGQKVIEFWHIQNVDPAPTFIANAVKRFEAANPDYKVNINITANDAYKQKIAIAVASNQLPDVFMSWTGGTTNEYIKAGRIIDLTSYMNTTGFKNKLLDAAVTQATVDGKIYGVPVENVSIEGVFYNKDLFARYNIKIPTTIAELEAACDTLKANGVTPFSLANMTQWTGLMYYQVLPTRHGGLEPFAKALNGTGSFEDPAFVWAAQKIQDWVRKGYFNEGFNGLDEDSGQSRTLMYTDRCAMQVQGNWFVPNVGGENPDYLKKLGFFPFPADETGTGNVKTVTGTMGDNFYHISSQCKYPEKAFEMLTYLLDEQSLKDRIAIGRIPPVKGVKLTDPVMQDIFNQVQQAPDIQFWYDQSLTNEVAEVLKTASQELFGLTITPQEFVRRWQAAHSAALRQR